LVKLTEPSNEVAHVVELSGGWVKVKLKVPETDDLEGNLVLSSFSNSVFA